MLRGCGRFSTKAIVTGFQSDSLLGRQNRIKLKTKAVMSRPASRSFSGSLPVPGEFKGAFGHGRRLVRRQSEMTLRSIPSWKRFHALVQETRSNQLPRSASLPSDLSTLNRVRKRGRSLVQMDGKLSLKGSRTVSVSFQPEVMMSTAAAENDVSELQSILDGNDIDVNYQSALGFSSLHHAAANGCVEAMQLLIEYEADVNIIDNQGRSPLDFAVRNGFFDCASILIKNGARVDGILNGGLHW